LTLLTLLTLYQPHMGVIVIHITQLADDRVSIVSRVSTRHWMATLLAPDREWTAEDTGAPSKKVLGRNL
jgi:hypothetical protein